MTTKLAEKLIVASMVITGIPCASYMMTEQPSNMHSIVAGAMWLTGFIGMSCAATHLLINDSLRGLLHEPKALPVFAQTQNIDLA